MLQIIWVSPIRLHYWQTEFCFLYFSKVWYWKVLIKFTQLLKYAHSPKPFLMVSLISLDLCPYLVFDLWVKNLSLPNSPTADVQRWGRRLMRWRDFAGIGDSKKWRAESECEQQGFSSLLMGVQNVMAVLEESLAFFFFFLQK